MSCSSFRERWEIGGPEEHAASCTACAEWLARQRQVASVLAHLAARLDRVALRDGHEAELRAAFRRASTPEHAPSPGHGPWTAAVLAAACLAVGIGLLVRGPGRPPEARRVTRAAPPRSAAAAAAPVERTGSTRAVPAKKAACMAAPVTRPRSASGEAASPDAVAVAVPASLLPAPLEESAVPLHPARLVEALPQSAPADDDGFYPLQPDAGRASLESGQIVRVRLRPDVLDAAGLPPRADGARGPVEAEVLIGPDGVARGIRLARPQR